MILALWLGAYSALWYVLAPLAVLRLVLRGFAAPAYRAGWQQRFGWSVPAVPGCILIHAVSVGEVQAAIPLISALRLRYPNRPLVISTTTPGGALRLKQAAGGLVAHVYAPYDLPGAVRRFVGRLRSRLLVIMETELWPNLICITRRQGIPVVVANARLSARSARGYRYVSRLMSELLREVDLFACQGPADVQRLIELGAAPGRVEVTGNMKFDLQWTEHECETAQTVLAMRDAGRPVWIVGSTHRGEEEVVLDALEQVRTTFPTCLLVIVPRHAERARRIADQCRRRGHSVRLSSHAGRNLQAATVLVVDTYGDLTAYYAACDVAFVGGSLVPLGGHSPIEPAAAGVPVLLGPHMFNFEAVTDGLVEQGAARRVTDAPTLAAGVLSFLESTELRRSAGRHGRELVERNRGAVGRVVSLLAPYLE